MNNMYAGGRKGREREKEICEKGERKRRNINRKYVRGNMKGKKDR